MNDIVAQENKLPIAADYLDELAQDSGKGFDGVTSADIAIPYYSILQAMSPQVKRGPSQIIGAEEGDIFNTVTQEFAKGDAGIIVIPCVFQKCWVEWTPRDSGGGFIQQHQSDEIMKQTTKDAKNNNVLPNGNHIVETAYHYVIRVHEEGSLERAIISMTSTQLKSSRRWMATQMGLQINVNGRMINPPPYSHQYVLTTTMLQKDSNTWAGWNIGKATMITNGDVYRAAKKFADDIRQGLVKVSAPEPEHTGSNDGGFSQDTEAF